MGLLPHKSMVIATQDRNAEARAEIQAAAREMRDQIRERVQQQLQQQRDRAEGRNNAQAPTTATQETPPNIIIHPPSVDRRIVVGGSEIPWDPNAGIPPQAVDMAIAFFLTVAAIVIGLPISRAFARRMDRKAVAQVPPEVSSQLQQLSQSVDAIALEVERISEGQRFTTRLLTEQRDATGHALPAGRDH